MELTDEIKEQLVNQSLHELMGEDHEGNEISCIVRTPTFQEFEAAFTDAFNFDKNLDFTKFGEFLLPKLYVSGDRKIVEDEELRFYAGEIIEVEFMSLYFLPIKSDFESVDDVKYITFTYEDKKCYVNFPDFKSVRYMKNEMMKGNKLIPIAKIIFAENLVKELSNLDFLTDPNLLLICGLSMLEFTKRKQFSIKKK